jgi:hypothetical protein
MNRRCFRSVRFGWRALQVGSDERKADIAAPHQLLLQGKICKPMGARNAASENRMAIDGKGLPWGSFDPMAGTIRDDGAWSLLLPRQECIGPMVRYSQAHYQIVKGALTGIASLAGCCWLAKMLAISRPSCGPCDVAGPSG